MKIIIYICAALCWRKAAATLIDLTHVFDNKTYYWKKSEGFDFNVDAKGREGDGYWYEANNFAAPEHGGTHMDAPCHFAKDRWTLDQIPVQHLLANAALIDISARAEYDPDTVVTPSDLTAWKHRYGPWQHPTIVLVRTGFSEFWSDQWERYFGVTPGEPGVRHFPGVGEAAAQLLATDPAVVGVGIDTASIDPGVSRYFEAHVTMFKANMFALENVANLSRVPAAGARILALPMKIAGGSGGPCRVLADVPDPAL